MAEKPNRRPRRKSGRFAPAFCNVMGTLIMLAVILSCVPLTLPRLAGIETLTVVSGSMEPTIPVGSLVFVDNSAPEDIKEGEIIAFQNSGIYVTHRAVENRVLDGEFVTKGDANQEVDLNTVTYDHFAGKVFFHVPMLGEILTIYGTRVGKIYAFAFLTCGFMFQLLAARLRDR